ncbi:threonine/serine exporter family protein [Paratissierella segnis]|jgi:uncharacterized membrane protein YjjB (DUF3815 family)|uniref:Threonine/serine exporter family protein n=1 Tax=Paratissierella segnis TaxID=2763679 RepID=A0A926ILL0_9FIRM|nr:threonine/serine exporter family protein [Paratissierella segnis]MBC8589485.1 threonine/serine exporter family protein [Paratissierella segnis]
MIWQIIGAFMATVAGSIYLEAPKNCILRTGIIGAAGWATYLLSSKIYGPVFSTYIAGLIISTISHIFSRLFKVPVTIFFIPGVFPIVPGLSMYRAVYFFIKGSSQVGQGFLEETIKISGMIALSIFTIDTIFKTIGKIKKASFLDEQD